MKMYVGKRHLKHCIRMENHSLSEYLLNFKILYNCVQTMHKNVSTTLGCIGLCKTKCCCFCSSSNSSSSGSSSSSSSCCGCCS